MSEVVTDLRQGSWVCEAAMFGNDRAAQLCREGRGGPERELDGPSTRQLSSESWGLSFGSLYSLTPCTMAALRRQAFLQERSRSFLPWPHGWRPSGSSVQKPQGPTLQAAGTHPASSPRQPLMEKPKKPSWHRSQAWPSTPGRHGHCPVLEWQRSSWEPSG